MTGKHYIIATQTGYLVDNVTGYPYEFATRAAAVKALAEEVKTAAQECRRSHKTCSVVGSARSGNVQIRVGGRQGYNLWQRYVINERPGSRGPAKESKLLRVHATRKKTQAQLDREIADSLATAKAREISDRRIAALVANGEDVRNSPAWRDAMSERRMINFQSGLVRPSIDRSKHTRVDIRWYALPNGNKAAGGFLPMIEEDGKTRGDTWANRGYGKAEAEAMAEAKAHEAAARFTGDWNIIVKKGRAKP